MTNPPNEFASIMLRAEHQLILRAVRVLDASLAQYEQTGQAPMDSWEKCVTFIRLFADACHHGKEEELLFPALEAHGIPREGGPIGVMLQEHRMGREMAKRMSDALAQLRAGDRAAANHFIQAARQYHSLITQHIFKEDNILFNMGDRILPREDQARLSEEFCGVNCRVFEGHRRETLEQIAKSLEAEWSQDLPN